MHSRRLLPGYALGLAALVYCGDIAAKGLYPTQFFSTINNPNLVVSADVNGDGHPDLIEIGSDQTVAVLINKGDGTFRIPGSYYSVGQQPVALAVADLRHNGKMDIVVLNSQDATVSVLLGNGDGTFKAPTATEMAAGTGTAAPTYPTGNDPLYLTIADLNGNGIPDIIVANFEDNTLSILYGRGDGSFKPAVTVPVGVGPIFVATADLTGDGKQDILVNNNLDDTLGVLLNEGAGNFKAMTTTGLGPKLIRAYEQMLVVGDFKHDGKPGVITTTTSANGDSVLYLAGKGDGTFETARTLVTGLQTSYLATADLNGDGFPDLVAGSLANNSVRVLFGNSNGGFATPGTDYPASGIAGGEVQRLTLADFSGTGKPDIAVVNTEASFVQLLYNDGTGHFHLKNSYPTGTTPSDVETAHLTSSGHLDLVECNSVDGTIGVRLGNGDGTFQAMQTYKVGANPQRVLLVDVDHDGILDAVTVNAGDDSVSVLLGDGHGGFGAAANYPAGPNLVDIAAGDMNNDGKVDLVVANAVVNTVGILYNRGDGTFKAPVTFSAGAQINGLALGDLQHSGFLDVVTIGSNMAVLHNDHKGGLTEPTIDQTTGRIPDFYSATGSRITLADVRHINQLDALIADTGNNQLVVFQNFGHGLFRQASSVFPTCGSPRSLAVADLNDDQHLDVVVACGASAAIGVMLGNGQGGFVSTPYPAENTPRGVVIGDFNEDGQPDIATVNGDSDIMNVLLQIPGVVAGDTAPTAVPGSLSVPDGRQPQNGGFTVLESGNATLSFVAVTLPKNGSFSYSSSDGTFTYTANTGFVGNDTMTFQVSDGVKLSNIATVTIDVASNPTGGSSHHGFLGAFWLFWLPILGLFAALRRRRS